MKIELIKKIKRILGKDIIQLFYRSLFFLSDEKYVKFIYRLRMGKSLNLSAPKAFSEKLQWLKVYDHNPKYSKMADKISMRDYVSSTIGEGHTVPILGVWDSFDAIDFDSLPSSFVLNVILAFPSFHIISLNVITFISAFLTDFSFFMVSPFALRLLPYSLNNISLPREIK